MIIQPPGTAAPDDIEPPHPVPGKGSGMSPVEITGGYKADFYGTYFQGTKFLSWSKCCV